MERLYALVELSGWLYLGLKPLRLLIVSVREGLRASYLGVIEGTFRVVSYAYAVQVLSWVPLLNVLVGLYGLYLCAFDFQEVHSTTYQRAATIAALPLLLPIVGGILFGILLGYVLSAG